MASRRTTTRNPTPPSVTTPPPATRTTRPRIGARNRDRIWGDYEDADYHCSTGAHKGRKKKQPLPSSLVSLALCSRAQVATSYLTLYWSLTSISRKVGKQDGLLYTHTCGCIYIYIYINFLYMHTMHVYIDNYIYIHSMCARAGVYMWPARP